MEDIDLFRGFRLGIQSSSNAALGSRDHVLYSEYVGLRTGGLDRKESACNVGDLGSIPGLGRSPGGDRGNLVQYSCLEESLWTEEPGRLQSMGSQSQTQLSTVS